MYNPIKQQIAHVNALKRVLCSHYNDTIFHPVTIFNDDAVLKVTCTEGQVMHLSKMCGHIAGFNKLVMSQDDVAHIEGTIRNVDMKHDKDALQKHIIRINEKSLNNI